MLKGQISEREDTQKDYYEELYTTPAARAIYDKGIVEDFFYEILNEKYFFSLLNTVFKEKSVVLDIGCGGGNIARHLRADKKIFLVNSDISKNSLRHAARFKKDGYYYVQASAFDIPFDDNTFDYCVTYGFLHHIDDTKAVLREVRRVLKNNGEFIAFEPAQRYPWVNMWLDFLHAPRVVRAKIENLYLRARGKSARKDSLENLRSVISEKNMNSEKHFFKTLEDYTLLFTEVFGKDATAVRAAFVEYMPPRFYFLRATWWARATLRISEALLRGAFFRKRARFVMMRGKKTS